MVLLTASINTCVTVWIGKIVIFKAGSSFSGCGGMCFLIYQLVQFSFRHNITSTGNDFLLLFICLVFSLLHPTNLVAKLVYDILSHSNIIIQAPFLMVAFVEKILHVWYFDKYKFINEKHFQERLLNLDIYQMHPHNASLFYWNTPVLKQCWSYDPFVFTLQQILWGKFSC